MLEGAAEGLLQLESQQKSGQVSSIEQSVHVHAFGAFSRFLYLSSR